EPDDRRLGVRTRDAQRGGARRQPPRLLRGLLDAPARERRLLALAPARLVEGHGPPVVVSELGRAGPPPPRQLRRVRARGLAREMARGARHRALDALLHGLWGPPAEAVLWPLPQGRGHRMDAAAAGRAPGAPSGRALRRAARARVAARPHALDEALSEPGQGDPRHGAGRRRRERELRGLRRRGHVSDAAARHRDGDYRAPRGQALGRLRDHGRRPLSGDPRVHTGSEGGHLPGGPRSPHADRAGLAPRLAQEARPQADAALPPVSHPRREAAAHAGAGVRARRRGLADLHRGAGGLPDRTTMEVGDRKSTRLNSSHVSISYAVFCLKKKTHHLQYYNNSITN